MVKSPVTRITKNGYTHNKIAEKVAKPSQLLEYRSESSILNLEQVEYIRFRKAFQEFFAQLFPKREIRMESINRLMTRKEEIKR